ncbi:MAG: hypothetical protein JRH15_17435 [Deltaproteobacteria bacterium]|nr:hypothetical protein [Deltaproteobacteria bacterium]
MQRSGKSPINRVSALVAACGLGVAGVLIFCVLPVLVGAVKDHLNLNDAQVGILGAVYFACYALMTLTSVFWIRRFNWRSITITGLLLVVAGLVYSAVNSSYYGIVIGLAAAGFGAAMLYALCCCMVSDMDDTDRKFAIKMIPEQLVPAILLFTLPALVIVPWGLSGLLVALAIIFGLVLLFTFWIPPCGRVITVAGGGQTNGSLLVFGALAALLVYFGGFAGLWAFFEIIATENNLDKATAGMLIGLSLISSGITPVIAAIIGDRFGRNIPMLTATAIALATLFLLSGELTILKFGIVTIMLPGACYVVFAYLMGLIAVADVSGRFAVLMTSALAFGATLGQAVFGVIKTVGGNTAAYIFAAALIIVGQLIAVWVNNKLSSNKKVETTGAEARNTVASLES